jgi:excisionase family DNA binding protein
MTMEQSKEPLVYTIPEAAKLLKISEYSAYEKARKGEIKTIEFGSRLKRVPGEWLRRLLAGESV